MKLKVNILKIKCHRSTAEISKDEVYASMTFFAGKQVGNDLVLNQAHTQTVVTDIKTGVKGGVSWIPAQNHTVTFDLGDSQVFGLSFSLHEKDNGQNYEALKKQEAIQKPEFPINGADIQFTTTNPSPSEWVQKAIEVLLKVYKFLRNDDMIGTEPFAYHVEDKANIELGKSFKFKRLFANYDVVLGFELLEG